MTKNQGILLAIALILLFTAIALATSSATSDVILYAFDQNPAGSDEGNEWVTIHNLSNESVDIGNWPFESTHGTIVIDWLPEGTTLNPIFAHSTIILVTYTKGLTKPSLTAVRSSSLSLITSASGGLVL